jgi:hypothetical protein
MSQQGKALAPITREESPFALTKPKTKKLMFHYNNQTEIRDAFWETFPELEAQARKNRTFSKGQNAQTADCRMIFCDWLDSLSRNVQISEKLAQNVTL